MELQLQQGPIPVYVTGTCNSTGYMFAMIVSIRGSFNTRPSYEKVPLCVTWDGVNYIESEDRRKSFNEEAHLPMWASTSHSKSHCGKYQFEWSTRNTAP